MRQVAKKGLITFAAAGGVLALSGGSAFADAGAHGGTDNSPGVLSGNNVQVPVDVPVNVCGNTVNVVGLLNPAMGNECVNDSSHTSHVPPEHKTPDHETPGHPDENKPEEDTTKPAPETQTVPDRATHAQLAQTGAGSDLGLGIGASAGLLLGGAVLYRRARVAQQR